jgi:hypothetical protein
MKKIIFLSIAILYCVNVFSQIEKGKFTISFEGNFRNTVPDNKPEFVESFDWLNGNLSLAPSLGYYLSDKIYVGVGMEMTWLNEISSSEFFSDQLYFLSGTETKTSMYLPYLFAGANFKLFNRCYVGGRVGVTYGKFEITTKTITKTSTLPDSDSFDSIIHDHNSTVNTLRDMATGYTFAIQVTSEISYFLSNHFCTYFTLGSLGFANTQSDDNANANYSNWIFDFTPSLWSLGFRVIL